MLCSCVEPLAIRYHYLTYLRGGDIPASSEVTSSTAPERTPWGGWSRRPHDDGGTTTPHRGAAPPRHHDDTTTTTRDGTAAVVVSSGHQGAHAAFILPDKGGEQTMDGERGRSS